jgi:hypothetical protein
LSGVRRGAVSRFGLCGIIKAQPGQRDALLDILLESAGLVARYGS